jgi:transcriptional regulator with XRE-family HTH domain
VRELRAQLGYTQEEFAERVGMFRTYMSRIENGSANPTLTMLYAIAGALDVSVIELLTPTEGGETSTTKKPTRIRSQQGSSRGRVTR